MNYIRDFATVTLHDIPLVGGKNASLGEMIRELSKKNIRVPQGFAVTTEGYFHFLQSNNLEQKIKELVASLTDYTDTAAVARVGKEVRALIVQATMPQDLAQEIRTAYKELSQTYKQDNCDVAVRSSATAEDLPTASFAGQQETFLNIVGEQELLEACKKAFASLFTDRALVYRAEQGFAATTVALSIGVQKMIRSDKACSGVMFTLDPESGFRDVVTISSSYGLGEMIVQGEVNPDEFMVYKPSLKTQEQSILRKSRGSKLQKMIYGSNQTEIVPVPEQEQRKFTLTDAQVVELAQMGCTIEEYYSSQKKQPLPMDIEWAQDGNDGLLYIVQARPETVHANTVTQHELTVYSCTVTPQTKVLCSGQSIGNRVAQGRVRRITNPDDVQDVQKDDIIVTRMTDPDWVPLLKKAAGLITDLGGRTCHAAIVSRELKIPAIIGTTDATEVLHDGQQITLDASRGNKGYVYEGAVACKEEKIQLARIPELPTKIMVNCADPEQAFTAAQLPVAGVGLARLEFIMAQTIGIHPLAVAEFEKLDQKTQAALREKAEGYASVREFFVQSLAQGIATIAAAFNPRPVIVRLTDFKSNEYRNLLGGVQFEPQEENPMLGWRGALRYITPSYEPAFALECEALKLAREVMGLQNIKLMVPFVRTVPEAAAVVAMLEKHGIRRGDNGLELYMMVEIPSNVLLLEHFAQYFDGFSIGSNDLTQLTLGVDRDSSYVQDIFSENDPAVKILIEQAITKAHTAKKPIGLCGQGPSDSPEFAQFLLQHNITSISLNQDAVIPFFMKLSAQ